jgi:hypothetical protein
LFRGSESAGTGEDTFQASGVFRIREMESVSSRAERTKKEATLAAPLPEKGEEEVPRSEGDGERQFCYFSAKVWLIILF